MINSDRNFLEGFTLVGMMITLAIIVTLAVIAIPNLLRARVNANESHAQATLRTISTAAESFAAANDGLYPVGIAALTGAVPPYLNEDYTAAARQGYTFACGTMVADDYCCTAVPTTVNVTGTRSFTINTGGIMEALAGAVAPACQ